MAQAYIADVSDESQTKKRMGMLGASFGVAFVIGPAIGGILAVRERGRRGGGGGGGGGGAAPHPPPPPPSQYFIESDNEASPFDRQHRAIAYQRAKQSCDTVPFGIPPPACPL